MNLLKSLTNIFKKKEKVDFKALSEGSTEVENILSEPTGFARPYSKFTEEQQLELIKFIAKEYTTQQIKEKMMELYNIKVSTPLIHQYRHTQKWKEKIRELRNYYRNTLEAIPASHKSVRIRRMEHTMDSAVKKGDLRVVVSANEQIRKEFEKDGAEINIFHNNPVYQQFNSLSNEELVKRQKEATLKLMQRRKENGSDRDTEENKG